MKKLYFFLLPLFLLSATLSDKDASINYVVSVKVGDFKQIKTLADFSERYKETSCKEGAEFSLVRVPHKGDPIEIICQSFECNPRALRLIAQAIPGDIFYMDEVMTICNKKEVQLEAAAFRIVAD